MSAALTGIEDLAIDPIDVFTSMVDANFKRVRLALAQGSLGVLLVVSLWRTRQFLDLAGKAISAADVSSKADRELLLDVARRHQRLADALEGIHDRLADERFPFRFATVRLLDSLIIKAEDVAETAALGASAEFAKLVKEHLMDREAAQING